METFLLNQKLSQQQLIAIEQLTNKENPVLFAIVSTINNNAKYADTTLVVLRDRAFVFDNKTCTADEPLLFNNIENVFNKFAYGVDISTFFGIFYVIF